MVAFLLAAADFKERMARFSRTVTLCVVTRDESSGQVSVEPDGTTAITYTLNAADEQTALAGIEKGLRVLIAAGATEIGTHQQDGERFRVRGMHILHTKLILKHFRNKHLSIQMFLIVHDCCAYRRKP